MIKDGNIEQRAIVLGSRNQFLVAALSGLEESGRVTAPPRRISAGRSRRRTIIGTGLLASRELITLEVSLRRADVALAREVARDALKNLHGATVRAPFTGVISLVNVEAEDEVTKDSRVIEIVDPTVLEVAGLVDAAQVKLIVIGAKATVKVDTLPGQLLAGTVSAVSSSPTTERGVVSYPVTIKVDIPEGVQIPVALSAVSVVVVYEERGALSVPRNPVSGTVTQPIVR